MDKVDPQLFGQLKRRFDQMDVDGTGVLDKDDLEEIRRRKTKFLQRGPNRRSTNSTRISLGRISVSSSIGRLSISSARGRLSISSVRTPNLGKG